MKVGILETGKPPAHLIGQFGRYPDMFRDLLGNGFDYADYDVEAGELPADPAAHDAWIVTGSPAGVYEDHGWIAPLLSFLRRAESAKLVGICFGHQAMAHALGGHVEKSDKGWGIGLHNYPIVERKSWMDGDGAAMISVPASHQDQVMLQPRGTDVIASSVFTPYAGLAWRDRPALSFQFHPELSADYTKKLIDSRRHRLPDPDAAIASLDAPNDNARVGGWIRRFLQG
ncbi:MAG: type 1 glutamine amidotransferase [Sphingomonas sp.]|nr:type 1 glutamine amidotransferase [Sphingomonas sp.]